jgi:hypothetical protein
MLTPLPGGEPPSDPLDDDPTLACTADAPTDEELCGLAPDPDADPPDGPEAWLADLPGPVRDELLDTLRPPPRPTVFGAGFLPRDVRGDSGTGSGFGAGEPLDCLEPGAALSGFAADAWERGLGRLTDDELIGLLTGWRRLVSWATAGELAAVTELTARRPGEAAAGPGSAVFTHLPDELATALTLTHRSANTLLGLAYGLARLPRTRAALATGQIDPARATVIVDELSALDDAQAAAVEAAIIGSAPAQTTGQLRAAVRRAVLAVDPAAAERRRKQAQQNARIEVWTETSGTAALAGRDLPPADVLAADKRIDALARQLKADGAPGSLDLLRAQVYTALLLGQPVGSRLPGYGENVSADSHGIPGAEFRPEATRAPGLTGTAEWGYGALAGSVNLVMPVATWLGAAGAPGEVAGFGPVDGETCRALGAALAADRAGSPPGGTTGGRPGGTAGRRGNRWCLTLTDAAGRPVAHGCARRPPARAAWALTVKLTALSPGSCPPHEPGAAGYHPSRRVRHLVETRHRTCSFRGCRRAAAQCDLDHTIPHHLGGATCRCNLAPLCRRHHQAKQAEGWRLDQPEPGILVWTLPHGRRYRVERPAYPVP